MVSAIPTINRVININTVLKTQCTCNHDNHGNHSEAQLACTLHMYNMCTHQCCKPFIPSNKLRGISINVPFLTCSPLRFLSS